MDPLVLTILIVGVAILLVLLIDRSGMNADSARMLSLGVIIAALIVILVKALPG